MNMNKLIPPFAIITCIASLAGAQPNSFPPSARESIEWCDIWISHADETNLPRVLLIGDSVTRGYYPEVEKLLAGKAYVARIATSRSINDPVLLQEVTLMLDNTKFDVIHFNNGLHGFQTSEKEYGDAFLKLVATLKVHAPDAKLIWASTTNLKEPANSPPDDSTVVLNKRIAARNAVALECLKGQNIGVDDLYALVNGHPEYHSDKYHFNDRGTALQAAQVAAHIGKLLDP